jgi:hypothetical protein
VRPHFYPNERTRPLVADTGTVHVVRIRETQEFDLEVTTTGDSRAAAQLARRRFLDMTVVEQAANSIGVAGRSFEAGDEEFDEDELAAEGDG